jgi:hypothetical protein
VRRLQWEARQRQRSSRCDRWRRRGGGAGGGGGEAVGSGGIQVLAIWMDAGNRCELDGDVTS